MIALTGTFGALVLVLSSLASRRLPGRSLAKLGLIWVAIFLFVLVAVRLLTLAGFT